jgi:hypothetical protein
MYLASGRDEFDQSTPVFYLYYSAFQRKMLKAFYLVDQLRRINYCFFVVQMVPFSKIVSIRCNALHIPKSDDMSNFSILSGPTRLRQRTSELGSIGNACSKYLHPQNYCQYGFSIKRSTIGSSLLL